MSAKEEVDEMLRSRGLAGLSAIGCAIRTAIRNGRIRIGPLKTGYYVLCEGYWLIANDLSEEEKQDALTWLACAELEIPLELRERLIAEAGPEIRGDGLSFPA